MACDVSLWQLDLTAAARSPAWKRVTWSAVGGCVEAPEEINQWEKSWYRQVRWLATVGHAWITSQSAGTCVPPSINTAQTTRQRVTTKPDFLQSNRQRRTCSKNTRDLNYWQTTSYRPRTATNVINAKPKVSCSYRLRPCLQDDKRLRSRLSCDNTSTLLESDALIIRLAIVAFCHNWA